MTLDVNGLQVEVRACTADDVPRLLAFIRAMASFEKLEVTATEDVLREAFFGQAPAARVLFALVGGTPIAYAIYFFTFGSMAGRRGLWLDDLFVDPAWRGKGIGQALMSHLAAIARENGCARFEWIVLDWNERAIRFYEQLGAEIHKEWLICRLDEKGIADVAGKQGEVR